MPAELIGQTSPLENGLGNLTGYPQTSRIVESVLEYWPEHVRYCRARFSGNEAEFLERMESVARLIMLITGQELDTYCRDYRWMCEEFLEEEVYFRRNARYRRSTFEEAYRDVYGDPAYMSRYVRGILISQLLWTPHARAIDHFRTKFLTQMPEHGSYLEIGPGHGLFLYFAAQQNRLETIEAWDVSQSSIIETRSTLEKLGVNREINIVEQDVLRSGKRSEEFDGVVISEVLEHLEDPGAALRALRNGLKPGGQIFINAPLNSPAPDHIYLWRTPAEFREHVEDQGIEIESMELFPVTGSTIESALRHDLSVSCVVIGRRPLAST